MAHLQDKNAGMTTVLRFRINGYDAVGWEASTTRWEVALYRGYNPSYPIVRPFVIGVINGYNFIYNWLGPTLYLKNPGL